MRYGRILWSRVPGFPARVVQQQFRRFLAMTISVDLFKEVFRRWPSGAAVVTSRNEGRAHGMVVGSFCSLSATPPLVMVSAGHSSRTHDIIAGGNLFAVSILSAEHLAIFERFAGFDSAF